MPVPAMRLKEEIEDKGKRAPGRLANDLFCSGDKSVELTVPASATGRQHICFGVPALTVQRRGTTRRAQSTLFSDQPSCHVRSTRQPHSCQSAQPRRCAQRRSVTRLSAPSPTMPKSSRSRAVSKTATQAACTISSPNQWLMISMMPCAQQASDPDQSRRVARPPSDAAPFGPTRLRNSHTGTAVTPPTMPAT